jgi:hypothetical protein
MVFTPLFGLLVDKRGPALALHDVRLAAARAGVPDDGLHPEVLVLFEARLPMAAIVMMGIAFSLIPAVMWPSVAYLVDQPKLGTAYGLMTMIQNIGLFGFNLLIGWSNDRWAGRRRNPGGYTAGDVDVLGARLRRPALRLAAPRARDGPARHGLETITTASARG